MRGSQVAMLQNIPGSQFEQATVVAEEQWAASPLTKENLAQLQACDEQSAMKNLPKISAEGIPGDFNGQQNAPPPQVDETEQGRLSAPKRPRSKRAPKKATQKRLGRKVTKDLLPSSVRGGGAVGSMSGQVETIAAV